MPRQTADGILIRGLTKTYPGVVALADVDLDIQAGSVVGLVGENGAGKSTLTKILAGLIPASDYTGAVSVGGSEARFDSPRSAAEAGIILIPQELSLHPLLSIAENVMLGNWPTRRGRVTWRQVNGRAAELLVRVGLPHDPSELIGTLAPSEQQLVAIARGLARDARVLILDEPTAALAEPEVARLLALLRGLRDEGVTIIYVTHRLDELFDVCDRIVVLRDGRVAADEPITRLSRDLIVERMLGSAPGETSHRTRSRATADVALRACFSLPRSRQHRGRALRDIDIEVRVGEVVGLVGLVGSGRTETLWSLYGALPRDGEVFVKGQRVAASPTASVAAGMALVTEERRATGLFPLATVADNIAVASYKRLSSSTGWIRQRSEDGLAAAIMTRLGIKAAGPRAGVGGLSGGNQQKTLLGRWLARGASVLLLDEPARGIDVGAKAEMYRSVVDVARSEGVAVLTTSSDVAELVEVCDRFLVLRDGAIVAEVPGAGATVKRLMEHAG